MAVIDAGGGLVAYAHATPPAWVRTAAAAEAWELWLTLAGTPYPPRIVTDCMALLDAAAAGLAAATAAGRPTARVWNAIAGALDGDLRGLRSSLVWMPAHTSCDAIGCRRKSDGRRVTVAEWRANQLADKLAKLGAPQTPASLRIDKTIRLAQSALLH